jgi:hypothetical protein
MRMRRIALCIALLAAVAACGTPPSSSDASAAPGDARFDGRQHGSGNVTDPADTTGTGIGTMGNGN